MQIHAHLIIAPSVSDAPLSEELRTQSVDVTHICVASFGIDDARSLIATAAKRPVVGTHRSFVVCASTLTREAQNALLKLFEEPPRGSVFYLIVPHESMLLPTLRSRLIQTHETHEVLGSPQADVFLSLSYADRLAQIADMQKRKDTIGMERLAEELASIAAADSARFEPEVRKTALFTESHIRIKGGSRKMLLEHLALALPRR